jgi:hypothetical protein
MTNPSKMIHDLVNDISPFVGRPVASSPEDAKFLQANPEEYLLRRAELTKPFPDELKARVLPACEAWSQIEAGILERFRDSRQKFLDFFEEVLEKSPEDGSLAEDHLRKVRRLPLYAAVFNICWVEAFTFLIPAGAPEFAEPARSAGRMMTAVFALEKMEKQTENESCGFVDTLKKLKACYGFATI